MSEFAILSFVGGCSVGGGGSTLRCVLDSFLSYIIINLIRTLVSTVALINYDCDNMLYIAHFSPDDERGDSVVNKVRYSTATRWKVVK